MEPAGLFIVFEGTEGAGKTTQLARVADRLKELGHDIVVTREPGGTPVAESIRELLLTDHDEPISPNTEMMLMCASRDQHLTTRIRPALRQGKTVLCSRFVDTTFAYQVTGRGASEKLFYALTIDVVQDTRPDLTVFIDIDPETSAQRQRARGVDPDRIEKSSPEFFERVNAMLRRLATMPNHVTIDGGGELDQVTDEIVKHILNQQTTKQGSK